MGISCFNYLPQDSSHHSEWVFKVNTFNILTLCLDEYVLDSVAEQFLITHGFDFEKQKKFGLNYLKGTQVSISLNIYFYIVKYFQIIC